MYVCVCVCVCVCIYTYIYIYKGKVHSRTGHEGPEGEKWYSSTLSFTSALEEGGWSSRRIGGWVASRYTGPIYIYIYIYI